MRSVWISFQCYSSLVVAVFVHVVDVVAVVVVVDVAVVSVAVFVHVIYSHL